MLEFLRDTPNATTLLGNHERKHLRAAQGHTTLALSQIIAKHQLGDRYAEWLDYFTTLPHYIDLPDALLVHGFYEPGVPLEHQRESVLVGTLSGEAHLLDNHPRPWYDHYDGPKPLVFGHHDYLRTGHPLIRDHRIYGIDTGVVHGGWLTALILPGFEIVRVRGRRDYWTAIKTAFAAEHDDR